MKKVYLFINKNLFLILALLIFTLSFFPQLQPIFDFLDSDRLAFKIGGIRVSLYLFIKGLVLSALLFWGASYLVSFGEEKIKKLIKVKNRERALIIKGFQIFVYTATILLGLDILGVNITTFTVFGGAIGIGIGVGLQKITANFISGLILLFEKTISEGDMLELEGGISVIVKRISARYTLVETLESREMMIPNEEFVSNRISNWTFSSPKARGQIDIGVAYGSDLEKVSELLLQVTSEHPKVLKDPAPTCYLMDFAESSIKFTLYFWIANILDGRMRPKSDMLFSINKKFLEHGIKIPFPQREIVLINGGQATNLKKI